MLELHNAANDNDVIAAIMNSLCLTCEQANRAAQAWRIDHGLGQGHARTFILERFGKLPCDFRHVVWQYIHDKGCLWRE